MTFFHVLSCVAGVTLACLALAAAGGAGAASASESLAGPPPIDYFTRDDLIGSLRIAPDGRHYAMPVGNLDSSGLLVVEVDSGRVVGGVRARSDGLIVQVDWVTNERLVFQIAERVRGAAYVGGTGEIYAMDFDGSSQRLLFGVRAGRPASFGRAQANRARTRFADGTLVSTLPQQPRHILISEQPWRASGGYWRLDRDAHPRLLRLDVRTGRSSVLGSVPLAAAQVLADHADRPRFAFGYDSEGSFRAGWRPEPDGSWELFELADFHPDSVAPEFLTPDDAQLYFTGVGHGRSLRALYRLHLGDGVVEQVYGHRRFDVEEVVLDPAGREVIGVRIEAEQPEYAWFDLHHPAVALYRGLEQAFPGQALRVTSVTPDGRKLTLFVHSDVNPGDYFLFNTKTREARHLQSARVWVDPALGRPQQSVWFDARDNVAVHGYVTLPDDGEGPFPLILMPHGGPHGVRDRWAFDWQAQLFASRGFAVLQVNFRGSSGYGRDFERAGFGEWGGRIQDDLEDAVTWAVAEGIAAPGRICAVGTSFGAYSAVMQLIRAPAHYACAVAHAGVYDLDLLSSTGDIPLYRGGRSYLEEALGANRNLRRQHSPVHRVEAITAPLLLIHGERDWRADVAHADALRAALDAAGKPYEWLGLEGEGHGVFDETTRQSVFRHILSFLEQHLVAGERVEPLQATES